MTIGAGCQPPRRVREAYLALSIAQGGMLHSVGCAARMTAGVETRSPPTRAFELAHFRRFSTSLACGGAMRKTQTGLLRDAEGFPPGQGL